MADPDVVEVVTVTASNVPHPARPTGRQLALVEELFRGVEPVHSPDDLARDAIFDDGEVEEFLADLYAMRHADTA